MIWALPTCLLVLLVKDTRCDGSTAPMHINSLRSPHLEYRHSILLARAVRNLEHIYDCLDRMLQGRLFAIQSLRRERLHMASMCRRRAKLLCRRNCSKTS